MSDTCQEHTDANGTLCGRRARVVVEYVDKNGARVQYPVCDGHALGIAMVDAQRAAHGTN